MYIAKKVTAVLYDVLRRTLRIATCNAVRLALAGLCAGLSCGDGLRAQKAPGEKPIVVKVVVIAAFERGEDTGDAPGEYQFWVEREHLDQVMELPAGYRHVRMNKDGVLGMVTGVATAKAAASVMALGLDPRFDLSKAYWIVAGIAGERSGGCVVGVGGVGGPCGGW